MLPNKGFQKAKKVPQTCVEDCMNIFILWRNNEKLYCESNGENNIFATLSCIPELPPLDIETTYMHETAFDT